MSIVKNDKKHHSETQNPIVHVGFGYQKRSQMTITGRYSRCYAPIFVIPRARHKEWRGRFQWAIQKTPTAADMCLPQSTSGCEPKSARRGSDRDRGARNRTRDLPTAATEVAALDHSAKPALPGLGGEHLVEKTRPRHLNSVFAGAPLSMARPITSPLFGRSPS